MQSATNNQESLPHAKPRWPRRASAHDQYRNSNQTDKVCEAWLQRRKKHNDQTYTGWCSGAWLNDWCCLSARRTGLGLVDDHRDLKPERFLDEYHQTRHRLER